MKIKGILETVAKFNATAASKKLSNEMQHTTHRSGYAELQHVKVSFIPEGVYREYHGKASPPPCCIRVYQAQYNEDLSDQEVPLLSRP